MDEGLRFGEWLEDRYLAKGFTQSEFAAAVGVSQPTVSSWVRGDALPTRPKHAVIERALDIQKAGEVRDRVTAERKRRHSERPVNSLTRRIEELELRVRAESALAEDSPSYNALDNPWLDFWGTMGNRLPLRDKRLLMELATTMAETEGSGNGDRR